MKRHLALVGFMASGKSTIGRKLARKLDWMFADTDSLVVSAHGPIAAIFSNEGEAAFRRYEQAAIRAALDRPEAHVIALGGGAMTVEENCRQLEDRAYRVFLQISPELVFARVRRSRGLRPMLGSDPSLARIKELYAGRMADYERADLTVEASHKSDAKVIEEILGWLRERIAGAARPVP